MTAIIAITLPLFNEIYWVADTRVSYELRNKIRYNHDLGLQKTFPILSTDSQSFGVIGFSGYLEPLQRIIHHLIITKKVQQYKAPFVIKEVVENLRCFIQEGYNKLSKKQKKLPFVFMFTTLDPLHTTLFRDSNGKIMEHYRPIYRPRQYIFKANNKQIIEVTTSDKSIKIIGSGEEVSPQLSPMLYDMVSVGRPNDNNSNLRSLLIGGVISEVFSSENMTTVGGPYWIWQLSDKKEASSQYWQWDSNHPEVVVERKQHDFVVTNQFTGEQRTILHVLNWVNKKFQGMLI